MKKSLVLLLLLTMTLPAYSILPPDASVIQVHDMQMINQQRFRMEEINDYNEVKQEKERYKKKQPMPEKIINKKTKFVEEDGKVKIEYEN